MKTRSWPILALGFAVLVSLSSTRTTHLNNVVACSLEYELGYTMHIHLAHDVVSMSLDGLHAQVEKQGNGFCAAALCQELHNLALAKRQAR
jgi:hypothetical protein